MSTDFYLRYGDIELHIGQRVGIGEGRTRFNSNLRFDFLRALMLSRKWCIWNEYNKHFSLEEFEEEFDEIKIVDFGADWS